MNALTLNLRALAGRAYPRIIGANREPSWIFFETFLPLLSVAAYVFIYRSLIGDEEVLNAYMGFVIIGGTMIAFWMNVLWSMASQLYWEKEIGNLQLYMMAPMSRMALLGGMAVGGFFMTVVRAVSTLIIGVVVFGITLTLQNPLMLLVVFFVTLAALYGMGMMFSSLYLLYGREAWHMSSLFEEPIFLVSGFYFPVKALFQQLGPWFALGASMIPMTLGLDAMRQLLFSGEALLPVMTVEAELTILLVLAVVFLILARYSLAYMERLAKVEGRLTLRHQ